MSHVSRKSLKWLLGGIVATAVLLGLLFAAFGVIVGRVPEYRVQLQDWLNERTGLIVEFKSLNARLRMYGPELVFNEAVVRTPDRKRVLAAARRGSVAFDLWNSIRTGRLTAGRFALEAPQIGLIRTREGRIQLVGQSSLPERSAEPFAIEKLPTGHFRVERAVVSFRDEITGRGPWSLSGVSFDLFRDPQSLRLRGDASLPKALGRKLEFEATVDGALENSAQLVSTFSVEGKELDLSGWADVLPDAWPAPETGTGSLEVRGALHGATLVQLAAHAKLANVATALPAWTMPLPGAAPMEIPGMGDTSSDTRSDADSDDATPQARTDQPPKAAQEQAQETDPGAAAAQPQSAPAPPEVVSYEHVAFDLRAQRQDEAWHLTISDLDLERPESSWHAARIDTQWSRDAAGKIQVSGKADRIVLDELWPMLAYLPESDGVAQLRALDASGAVDDLAFEFSRADASAAPHYDVQAKLEDVGFQPVGNAPGLGGLSGHLHATEQGGDWQIASSNVRFDLPRMFRETLTANAVEGKLEWQRSDAGWSIASRPLNLETEDGTGVVRLGLLLPADSSSPVLDLSGEGHDLRVSSVHKYIPAARLGKKTMEWFDHAFVDGRVKSGALIYKGPVRAFPFRNNEGTFFVRGHVEDATFAYQPDWAPATQVVADVEFRNAGMHVHASSANVANLQVSEATADIADLMKTRLVIQAAAKGALHDGIELLKNSPVGPKLGELFARLQGEGPIRVQLGLDLPIRNLDDRRVDVTTQFTNATASLQGIDAPVSALNGTLRVHNTLLAAADLEGHWLGAPLTMTVRADGPERSTLVANGHASAERLQPLLGLSPAIRLSGATDWHLSASLPAGGSEGQRTVDIDSDLEGLGIGLPYPLGKSDDEARPLRLALQFDGDDVLMTRGSLGDVRSLVRLRRGSDGWELDRGGVRADGIAPALPDHRGIRIEGALDHFSLDDWLALKGGQGGGKPLSYYLHAANVRVGTFEALGYQWPDVRGMLQTTTAGWRVDVDGANAAGQIIIPESFTGAQPLRATLDRLVLDKAQQSGTDDGGTTDPRNVPNLQVYISDLRMGARTIGAVELRTSRVAQGFHIENATIVGESVSAEGQGDWLMTNDGPRSSLKATITSSDVAATLRALGYREVVQGKRGEVRADLTWPGAFDMDFLDHASGTIAVDAESGQVVVVQPGAGRVLGLFSVAALPRRLALDFTDLTEKGLAFDTVHGDFELRDGNAYTSNLLLRGPAAEIGIVGRTGLGAKDYDQTAVVTGNLGVSLPVAGALAGGPVIGAAVLLFSQVFKGPLKGITRGYYRITGPWDDPVVERVDAAGVKAEASRGR